MLATVELINANICATFKNLGFSSFLKSFDSLVWERGQQGLQLSNKTGNR